MPAASRRTTDFSFPIGARSTHELAPGFELQLGGHVPQLHRSRTDPTNYPRKPSAVERRPELRDVWAKIDSALFHLRRFREVYDETFPDDEFVTIEWRDSPDNRQSECFIALSEKDTSLLASIFGDYVHNLRTCLDYVAWLLVQHGGGGVRRQAAFPLARLDDAKQRKTFDRRTAGMHPDAVRLLKALQPSASRTPRDTQHALGLLEELDAADKHRTLAVVGAAVAEDRTIAGVGHLHKEWHRSLVDSDVPQKIITISVDPPHTLDNFQYGIGVVPCLMAAESREYIARPDFEVLGSAVIRVLALVNVYLRGEDPLSEAFPTAQ